VTGTPETVEAGSAPRRIGRYQAYEVLGRGAMGVVYRGRDPLLQRDVAIKVMGTSIVADGALRARLEREARAIARLAHPNLVTVFDLGYEDDAPYVVMELLRGHDLADVLARREPLALERKLVIVLQVLAGLAHAHRAGIVHRDVKPGNVFLTEDGRVRLLDFGMARFLETASQSSNVMGTANYMSPEQLEGREVDGRSDLFACGSMLFELLAGWPPFHAENVPTIAYRVVHKEPDYARVPAEAAALRPVLQRALAKDVDARYADAAGMARDLVARAGLPASVLPSDLAEGASAARGLDGRPDGHEGAGPAEGLTIDLRSGPSPRRRWRAIGLASGLALAVIVAAAVTWIVRQRPSSAPSSAASPVAFSAPPATVAPMHAAGRPGGTEHGRGAVRSEGSASVPGVSPPPVEASLPPSEPPVSLERSAATAPEPGPRQGRWQGYLTDESCKTRGAVDDHWECAQVCMRKGYRPMLAVDGALYYLAGVERIHGDRNRRVVVEGTLDTAARTITVSALSTRN
jgi:eukaryotic-like serine/threonine-protein kinase